MGAGLRVSCHGSTDGVVALVAYLCEHIFISNYPRCRGECKAPNSLFEPYLELIWGI